MASSEVEMSNMALSHIGVTRRIQSLTEKSVEAKECQLWYPKSRDYILHKFNWPFAQKYKTLGKLADDPNSDWAFAYEFPSDCVRARRVLSGVGRVERDSETVPFTLANDSSNLKVIFTDKEDAVLQYTRLVEDPTQFSAEFVEAVAFRIAMQIAMPLSVSQAIRNEVANLYREALDGAEESESNEVKQDAQPDSEFISVRL